MRQNPEHRFWKFVVVDDGNNGCWPWSGSKTRDGYGCFCPGGRGKLCRAHRWSYERFVGPIPPGLHIDHLCRRRDCVNPWHLEPVTNAENHRRGALARERATHCKYGHEFTQENTYTSKRGSRNCRACLRRRQREWRLRSVSPFRSAEASSHG